MENDILITIVVTIYNKASYVEKCLDSISLQTDKKYKLIIIDDGSEDDSYDICKEICKSNHNIRLISCEHTGVAAVRNIGLKLADTKYILFVDGDDTIHQDTIHDLNEIIEKYDYDLLIFGIFDTMPDGSVINNVSCNDIICTSHNNMKQNIIKLWSSGLMYSSCNKLFKVQKVRENNILFPDKDFGEDLDFVCRYFMVCSSMYNTRNCYYFYTQHTASSLSKKFRNDLFDIRKFEYKYMNNFFIDNEVYDCPEAQEFLARRHIERIVGCIENEVSVYNKKSIKKKIYSINKIVSDQDTIDCIKKSSLKSKKMKILVLPIKYKLPRLSFIIGLAMTFVRNTFPKMFLYLKTKR
ncbi:MAG: glycosyltransferase family 2 protein [Oscillospiraceae bacterium]|nr:glycosyltransferase family 2 protein [Oscillospiraceae bacterium]